MKQTDRTNNHGLFKLLLFTFVMLLPIGAWGQTVTVASYMPDYDGTISGDGITGTVTFEGETLTLKDATITGNITWDGSYNSLNVKLIGHNTITGGFEWLVSGGYGTAPSVYFQRGDNTQDCSLRIINDATPFTGFTGPTVSGLSWYEGIGEYIVATDYKLSIGNIAVTSYNAGAIQTADPDNITVADGGSVSFDAVNNTLTLDNAILKTSISSSLDNLKVKFKGTNKVNTDKPYDYYNGISSTVNTATLTFEKDNEGTLELNASTNKSIVYGFASVSYSSGDGQCYLHPESPCRYTTTNGYYSIYGGSGIQLATISGETAYPLWLIHSDNSGEHITQVTSTSITSDAITKGTVNFYPTDSILSLSEATIDGKVVSAFGNLKIKIDGANIIASTDSGSVVRTAVPGALTIIKNGDNASLQLNTSDKTWNSLPVIQGFTSLSYEDLNLSAVSGATYGEYLLYDYDADEDDVKIYGFYDPNKTEGYEMRVASALFTTADLYPLWVGNTQVTTDNADDIIGTAISGKVSFDVDNNILTLQRATINMEDNYDYPIMSSLQNLTINLVGENIIKLNYGSPKFIKYVGTGETAPKLTFETTEWSLNGQKNLVLGSLNIEGISSLSNLTDGYAVQNTFGEPTGWTATGDVDADFLLLSYQGAYKLTIGKTLVTSDNADDVLGDGTVKFSVDDGGVAVVYTLTLKDATITAPIKIGLSNLIFDIQGTDSIKTDETCIQKMNGADPSLTFKSTSDEVGSLILTHEGGVSEIGEGKISLSSEVAVLLTVYGEEDYTSRLYYIKDGSTSVAKFVPSYGVTVNETQVYAGNATKVLGDRKVSFDKDSNTLTLDNASSISYIGTSLSTLNINLIGDNSLYRYSDGNIFDSTYGADSKTINIKSTNDIKGSLSIATNDNSSSVFFKGDNVTLNIVEPLSVLSGYLENNSGTVVIGMNYGISVTKNNVSTFITSSNRKNVLNEQTEPSVQFDGVNTLILNNAELSSIQIDDAQNIFSTSGLTIYLKGDNTINNGGESIINNGNSSINLTFATGDGTTASPQGTLTCSYSDPGGGGRAANSLFDNIDIVYANRLSANLDTTDPLLLTATISTKMEPIVMIGGEIQINDGDGDGLGEDIEFPGLNDIEKTALLAAGYQKNDILYTLPDPDDGYMQENSDKLVAINSYMTDEDVNNILANIKLGVNLPGTPEFAEGIPTANPPVPAFHGLTFLLPSGKGEIILEVNTNEHGILHVKVGDNDPVEIKETDGFEEVTIPYALTNESYVFIYSVAPSISSSRFDGPHRAPGKKLTTTTQIRRAGVKAGSVGSTPPPPLSPKTLTKADVKAALDALDYIGQGLKINDTEIVGIENDAFEDLTGTQVTFVDLSKTAIVDQTIDRREAPFNGVPDGAFIYLPTGNDLSAIDDAKIKNVVLGTVCPDMLLPEGGYPFSAAMDFTAKKAVQERVYTPGEKGTIFLPFAINKEMASELGTFYQIASVSDNKVTMGTVEETKANVPYMFDPAKETLSVEMVDVKTDVPDISPINDFTFIGTYEKQELTPDNTIATYCFIDGQFVYITGSATKVTVNPFRAFMYGPYPSSGSQTLDIDWGDDTTDLNDVRSKMSEVRGDVFFDLQGRRVMKPTKGIYIHNGKKVVIK